MPGGSIATERRTGELMKSPFKFKKYGQCGMDVSEFWPHLSAKWRTISAGCVPSIPKSPITSRPA